MGRESFPTWIVTFQRYYAGNDTEFANPYSGIGDSQLGQITSAQHQPRIIQVAGNFRF